MSIKVNIFSPGRFHVCDLARELDKHGYDVKFYSFVPTKRTEKFGLPKKCTFSLYVPMIPFLFLEKIVFKHFDWSKRLRILVQDWLTSLVMRKADIVISMSGSYLLAPRKAKEKGSIIIYERGSKHILEQKRILEAIPGRKKESHEFYIRRELDSYNMADYISIASKHVYNSFIVHNYPNTRLFINHYGVDLKSFYPIPETQKIYDVIMVGGWSYRKGCDLIIQAIQKTGLKLLHVGSIVDLDFPDEDNFTHIPSVDQKELVKYYAQAKVAVLPSREDGFGMVLSQAMACGLPIVGSPDTGAVDLRKMVELPEYIEIMESYSSESIINAINKLLFLREQKPLKSYAGNAVEELTWEAYGNRYSNFIDYVATKHNII